MEAKINKKPKFDQELIAPCGMNCGVCVGYLNFIHDVRKDKYKGQCQGCRPRDKHCTFLKQRCDLLKNKKVKFCFECKNFPCEQLLKLDKRYKKKGWDVSFSGNNKRIKEAGLKKFIEEQEKKFQCPKCGGTICIHTKICYDCQIES